MAIQSGYKKIKRYQKVNSTNFKLISYWTSSESVSLGSSTLDSNTEITLSDSIYDVVLSPRTVGQGGYCYAAQASRQLVSENFNNESTVTRHTMRFTQNNYDYFYELTGNSNGTNPCFTIDKTGIGSMVTSTCPYEREDTDNYSNAGIIEKIWLRKIDGHPKICASWIDMNGDAHVDELT
jgi:hypothetical protein